MSEQKETRCVWCGSRQHHPDRCPKAPSAATVPESVKAPLVGSGRLVGPTGAELIAEERRRQMSVEGWTPDHDAKHRGKQLAKAACSYLISHCDPDEDACGDLSESRPTWDWPWAMKWWKPSKEPVRNLVKAGALIAAEIDRLLAAEKTRRPNK